MKKDCGKLGCLNDHRREVLAGGEEVIEQSGDFRCWPIATYWRRAILIAFGVEADINSLAEFDDSIANARSSPAT